MRIYKKSQISLEYFLLFALLAIAVAANSAAIKKTFIEKLTEFRDATIEKGMGK